MKSRVFNILQFWTNPQEVYLYGVDKAADYDFDEFKAEVRLTAKKTFTEWALITHDQDVYTAYDEDRSYERLIKKIKSEHPDMEPNEVEAEAQSQKYVFEGNFKPKHTHIVIRTKTPLETSQVAKWLGIPDSMVEVPKGRGAFADCLFYLCHEGEKEQAAGKHVYPRDLVKSNFNWQDVLRQSKDMLSNYGQELSIRDFLRSKVRYEGYSIERLIIEFPDYKIDIMNDEQILKKCRKEYVDHIPVPPYRINYYVEGRQGGIGKGIACRALAHCLYPDLEDYECFFEVGSNKVSFDGYNGQPVIIWNDWRSYQLIKTFGRGETFDILDSHPTRAKRNIKYGSTVLTNTINLINSVQPYTEFLNGLAGEYTYDNGINEVQVKAEDKNQAYRRFPIIICLRENDFDVLLNKGVAEGSYEYEQYLSYAQVRGSFANVAQRLTGTAKEQKLISLVEAPLSAGNIIRQRHEEYISDPNQIPDEFEHYGEIIGGQLSMFDTYQAEHAILWPDLYPGETPESVAAELDQHAKVQSQIEMFPILAQHDDPDRSTGDGSASPAGAG